MEQRGVLLGAMAKVLNAGGAALVNVYDAVASIKTGVGQGERGRLKARLRECEKKLAHLYLEIGKEVALREPEELISASGEAGIKLAGEYRAEMEKIKQRLKDIEEAEKAAREAAIARARKWAETAAKPGKTAASKTPEAGEVSTGAVTEETKEIVVEAPETPTPEIDADTTAFVAVEAGEAPADIVTEAAEPIVAQAEEAQTQEMEADSADSAEPAAGNGAPTVMTEEATGMPPEVAEAPEHELQEAPFDSEMRAANEAAPEAGGSTEALENMLKNDLLKLCLNKGIEADKRMTKAEIIELIRGRL